MSGPGPDGSGHEVLLAGRVRLPWHQWLLIPAAFVVVAAVVWLASGGDLVQTLIPAVGMAAVFALVAFFESSWRWRITRDRVEIGRLGWPVFRGDIPTPLALITRVEAVTGSKGKVKRAVNIGPLEGRLFGWMRGAVVADKESVLTTFGRRVVIGTDTPEEAQRAAEVLRQAVAAVRQREGGADA